MLGFAERLGGRHILGFFRRDAWKFLASYIVLLGVLAYLGRWTPGYLEGRDLWHFMISRMVVAAVMLGVLASFVRLVPAALLLGATLLLVGTISAIKRGATGEPFQVSDLFLMGQSPALLNYAAWSDWLKAAVIVPALFYSFQNFRFRTWSLPLASCCVALLATYRIEPVVNWIHDNSYWIGVENLTFSQAESERMNGLATHLYFSTAGLRLKTYSHDEVQAALAALDIDAPKPPRNAPPPDLFIVLGEAWWRDPTDAHSPIDKLVAAGFSEGTAISPVYGGTTPNSEFEVLTAIPAKSFMSGIIPYQHYLEYFTDHVKSLPHLLGGLGYTSHAYHNFEHHYWLRDQVYPRFGFDSFDSMETMTLVTQANGWPKDDGLYAKVEDRLGATSPQFHFIVTVQTHGPYAEDKSRDVIGGESHPGISDYHDRLSGAVDGLIDFNARLNARGRPYVLFVFGDHLPGIRLHQWKIGWKSADDPRLHEVPFLVISNSENAQDLRDRLHMRPLACVSPVIADWLQLGIADHYMRYMTKICDAGTAGTFVPSEAVIQNQLFSKTED
jgi:phosphoglycerol transferase MdoB-like AlkP superfamily enzyme